MSEPKWVCTVCHKDVKIKKKNVRKYKNFKCGCGGDAIQTGQNFYMDTNGNLYPTNDFMKQVATHYYLLMDDAAKLRYST